MPETLFEKVWRRHQVATSDDATLRVEVHGRALAPEKTHGARVRSIPLNSDFALPSVPELLNGKRWDSGAALTLVTTPNAPTGRGYSTEELDPFCAAQRGVVLLDEAYADFAKQNALKLALKYPHVLVARTFSKAYSLCFLRIGYSVGHPELIGALDRIRDSYNVNGLGQIAALATLENISYYQKNFHRVIATRERLTTSLQKLGFEVLPSQTNFILAKPPCFLAEEWLLKLRAKKILVRWFQYPEVREYLRISIGNDRETDALLNAVRKILNKKN